MPAHSYEYHTSQISAPPRAIPTAAKHMHWTGSLNPNCIFAGETRESRKTQNRIETFGGTQLQAFVLQP